MIQTKSADQIELVHEVDQSASALNRSMNITSDNQIWEQGEHSNAPTKANRSKLVRNSPKRQNKERDVEHVNCNYLELEASQGNINHNQTACFTRKYDINICFQVAIN